MHHLQPNRRSLRLKRTPSRRTPPTPAKLKHKMPRQPRIMKTQINPALNSMKIRFKINILDLILTWIWIWMCNLHHSNQMFRQLNSRLRICNSKISNRSNRLKLLNCSDLTKTSERVTPWRKMERIIVSMSMVYLGIQALFNNSFNRIISPMEACRRCQGLVTLCKISMGAIHRTILDSIDPCLRGSSIWINSNILEASRNSLYHSNLGKGSIKPKWCRDMASSNRISCLSLWSDNNSSKHHPLKMCCSKNSNKSTFQRPWLRTHSCPRSSILSLHQTQSLKARSLQEPHLKINHKQKKIICSSFKDRFQHQFYKIKLTKSSK